MKGYTISGVYLRDLPGVIEPSMIQYNLPIEDAMIMAQNLMAGVQARLTQRDASGRVDVDASYVRLTTTAIVVEKTQ